MTGAKSLERHAIVVLGAFYSGVGVMRRVLARSGVHPGSEAPPTSNAADGEGSEVAALSARILTDLDTSWRDPVPPLRGAADDATLERYRTAAREIIARQFGQTDLVSFGAPGAPLLLRFWCDALTANGFRLHYVVMVRNPLESAQSLKSHAKINRNASLLLWANYMVAADLETRNQARLFVRFDDLLAEPEAILDRIETRFDLKLPRRTWESVIEIENDIDSTQRRHVFAAQPKALKAFPQLRELYDYFESSAREQPRNVDAARQTEEWLSNLSQTMGPLLAQAGQDLRREAAAAREARDAAQTARAELERASRRASELETTLDTVRGQSQARLAEVSEYAAALEGRIAALDRELAERREALEAAGARLDEGAASLERLERERSELFDRLEGERARLEAALRRVGELEATEGQLKASEAALERQQAVLTATLEKRELELQRMKGAVAALEADLSLERASAADLSALAERRATELRIALERASAAESRLSVLERDAAETSVALRAAADRLGEVKSELDAARADAVATSALNEKLEVERAGLQAALLDAEADRATLNLRLQQRERELSQAADQLVRAEQALEASRLELKRADEVQTGLSLERAALETRALKSEAEQRVSQERAAALEAQLKAAEAQTRALAEEAERREAEVHAAQSRLIDLERQAQRATEAEQALSTLRLEMTRVEGASELSKQEAILLRHRLTAAEDEARSVSARLAAKSRYVEAALSRVAEIEAVAAMDVKLRRAWTIEREALSAQAQAATEELRRSEARSADLEAELDRLRAATESQPSTEARGESTPSGALEQTIEQLRSELEAARAQSQALARAMSDSVAEDRGGGWRLLGAPLWPFGRRSR